MLSTKNLLADGWEHDMLRCVWTRHDGGVIEDKGAAFGRYDSRAPTNRKRKRLRCKIGRARRKARKAGGR